MMHPEPAAGYQYGHGTPQPAQMYEPSGYSAHLIDQPLSGLVGHHESVVAHKKAQHSQIGSSRMKESPQYVSG